MRANPECCFMLACGYAWVHLLHPIIINHLCKRQMGNYSSLSVCVSVCYHSSFFIAELHIYHKCCTNACSTIIQMFFNSWILLKPFCSKVMVPLALTLTHHSAISVMHLYALVVISSISQVGIQHYYFHLYITAWKVDALSIHIVWSG